MGLLRKLTNRRASQTPSKASSTASSPAASPTSASSPRSPHSSSRSERPSASRKASTSSGLPTFVQAQHEAEPTPAVPTLQTPVPPRARLTSVTSSTLIDDAGEEEDGFVTASEGEDESDDLPTPSSADSPKADDLEAAHLLPESLKPVEGVEAAAPVDATPAKISPRRPLGKAPSELTATDVAVTPEELREDVKIVWEALSLFLSSRMKEAEEICLTGSDHRLYFAVGYALIQAIKSMATFEPNDLEDAIECCRNTISIAQLLRKHDYGLLARVGSIAKGSASVASVRSMTPVQRHAELVYAECTLLKARAVLSMAYAGDFVAFLKEALNMRSAYSTYRTLEQYIESEDDAWGDEDPKVDRDFRSGVNLGNGMISLILSLLPSTVLKIMDVIGFSGDRDVALRTLMKPGGVGGVDIEAASRILKYNLAQYPNGIFFLYYAGRLKSTQTLLEEATTCFERAIDAQREYKQLGHICYWDLGLAALAQGDWARGYEYFGKLESESNWSKAIYTYAKAIMLYEQLVDPESLSHTMHEVPRLLQRIAGKSIPLEKFVSRRARKFIAQDNRLLLAGLDLAYVLNCFGLCPGFVLHDVHLKRVDEVLAVLAAVEDPSAYGQGNGEYWDDFCLAHMLRGVIYRVMAHPEPYVVVRPPEPPVPTDIADSEAARSFQLVLSRARDIQHDHHLVWFTHYELGRLHHAQGHWNLARDEYELVLSGKNIETSTKKGKGKVTLQNMAVLRSNAGLQLLREQGH
ncbi:hypothetical protein JCM8202v2_000188 [Rhodotorula sphaerocarpa]